MDKKLEMISTYDRTATEMTKKFDSLGGYPEDIKRVFSYLCKKENPKVTEIGCGSGRDAKEILKYTNEYLGIDISKEFIKHAKKAVPQGNFLVADMDEFDFPKGTDAVFALASLLHSDKESVKNILEKVYHSLNEQGVFFVSLKYGEYKELRKTDEFGTRTYYYYTPEIIKDLAGEKFKPIFEKKRHFQNQDWFNIILQKQSF